MKLDWIVDRRGDAGPVIDQGNRPTCLSCATSSAHHEIVGEPRSIEFLHHGCRSRPGGYGLITSVRDVLDLDGQPPEDQWPYEPHIDDAVAAPPANLPGPFTNATLTTSAGVEPPELVDELRADTLPLVGLVTTRRFMRLSSAVLTEPDTHLGRHAVLLVGAATYSGPSAGGLADGDLLLCIQNSWGTNWGANGYGLIGPRAWADMALVTAVVAAV